MQADRARVTSRTARRICALTISALKLTSRLPFLRTRLLDFPSQPLACSQGQRIPQLRTASTPNGPSDDDLRQLAAGLSSDAVATKTHPARRHLRPLRPLLRTSLKILR